MSTSAKVIIGILVLALIALGVYYFMGNTSEPLGTDQGTVPAGESATSPNDASDAALAKDAASIDAQVGAFTSDNSSVDQGLNDQPIAQ